MTSVKNDLKLIRICLSYNAKLKGKVYRQKKGKCFTNHRNLRIFVSYVQRKYLVLEREEKE